MNNNPAEIAYKVNTNHFYILCYQCWKVTQSEDFPNELTLTLTIHGYDGKELTLLIHSLYEATTATPIERKVQGGCPEIIEVHLILHIQVVYY